MMFSRSRKFRQDMDGKVDMTPMLDIVFIMLIFFIVTAVFLNEKGIDLTQSNGEGGENVKSIGVYVYENGAASVNGHMTDVLAVPARVELLRAEFPGAAVSIRAEHETPFKNLVFLKDQFKIANISTSIRIDPAR